jgi:hypothetical protein
MGAATKWHLVVAIMPAIIYNGFQLETSKLRGVLVMAKKKTAPPADQGNAQTNAGEGSIAGYFRKIFEARPRLLGVRSNEQLLKQWLADHPDHPEVPQTVKNNLSNLKSVLRSKKRRKVARRAEAAQANGVPSHPVAPVARKPTGSTKLEALELQIDECLILARQLDRQELHDVITLLRRARNAVVWKIGQ